MNTRLDHLVVAARTLDDGVAWCEAVLGITPGPGGRHPLMGTHNRLFGIASVAFPQTYFEIIAIDPHARTPARARWFGLDAAPVQAVPCLLHFVARTADIRAACAVLAALGEDCGIPSAASRATPQGELQWQISVREDGRLPHGGALPTLIEWGVSHPTDDLPASGVTLAALSVQAAEPGLLSAAYAALSLSDVTVQQDAGALVPRLCASLNTPRGRVVLQSAG
ncbi:MAG: VOC family protein [Methylibium sp.]|uniref:VOC family protein n=1 Tax=Methylibium sp. TaxID=2067992 RepID=UPI00184C5636|nr:VOC family protein [Methylibium sp.]MBA3598601.1 VOC family protein [Methylibium sp.]